MLAANKYESAKSSLNVMVASESIPETRTDLPSFNGNYMTPNGSLGFFSNTYGTNFVYDATMDPSQGMQGVYYQNNAFFISSSTLNPAVCGPFGPCVLPLFINSPPVRGVSTVPGNISNNNYGSGYVPLQYQVTSSGLVPLTNIPSQGENVALNETNAQFFNPIKADAGYHNAIFCPGYEAYTFWQQYQNPFMFYGFQQMPLSSMMHSQLVSIKLGMTHDLSSQAVYNYPNDFARPRELLEFDGSDVEFFLESFKNEAQRANIPMKSWACVSKRFINVEIWAWLELEGVADWDEVKRILKARYCFPNVMVTRANFYQVLDKVFSLFNLNDGSFSANGCDIADGILQVRALIKAAERRFGLAALDYQKIYKKLCQCIPSFAFIIISATSDHLFYRWIAGKEAVDPELVSIHFQFLETLRVIVPAFRSYKSVLKEKKDQNH